MNFFDIQAQTKKRTAPLVALFGCAVFATMLTAYVATVLLAQLLTFRIHPDDEPVWWRPEVAEFIVVGSVIVLGAGSLLKWLELRSGGRAVAGMVGAILADPRTPAARQLLNIVEEMAIASGLPVPGVFVLDRERGINAFAAGLTPADAVIVVTQGALDHLGRDELQGLVAHEFSHILNADTRLNIRLAAVIFSLIGVTAAGRSLVKTVAGIMPHLAAVLLSVVGLAIMAAGGVGWFFGRLLQAAVCRQREQLADAAAVQFTRNPAGLAGALKKIGGHPAGSGVAAANLEEIQHFLFAQGFRDSFFSLFDTHPQLARRILALDPCWDGAFIVPAPLRPVAGPLPTPLASFPPVSRAGPRRLHFRPTTVLAGLGSLEEIHFHLARSLLAQVPAGLRDAARDPALAPALVCGLLLSGGGTLARQQLELVARQHGSAFATRVAELRPALGRLDPSARLPLLQLALPALRSLNLAELDRLLETLDQLVQCDGEVTPFELALQKVTARQLRASGPVRPRAAQPALASLAAEITLVLAAFARAGARTVAEATAALATGLAQLNLAGVRPTLPDAAATKPDRLGPALDQLALAPPATKQHLLLAAAHVIAADNVVTPAEAELFRAVAAILDVPMPPLAPVT